MECCIITSDRAENQYKPNNILTSTYVNTHVWLHVTLILQSVFVTGFWKTDQNVTLGLFHFIGQTNGYTRTLHIHSVSIRLG